METGGESSQTKCAHMDGPGASRFAEARIYFETKTTIQFQKQTEVVKELLVQVAEAIKTETLNIFFATDYVRQLNDLFFS